MLHWLYVKLRRLERIRGNAYSRSLATGKDNLSVSQRAAKALLGRCLHESGYDTITEFAEQYPYLSIDALGRALRLPVNAYWAISTNLLREAEQSGTVEHHVRSLIVRDLRNRASAVPPPDDTRIVLGSEFEGSLITVATKLPIRYRSACYRIALAHSMARMASTWTPIHADDVDLQELFSYWDESTVEVRSLCAPTVAKASP